MSAPWDFSAALNARRQEQLFRQRLTLDSPQSVEVQVEGKDYLAFCSNDYLGLANDPRLIEVTRRAVADYGVGGGASHLVLGHMRPHQALEEQLAAFVGCERALLFSTGYMANLGVTSALLQRRDVVVQDKYNHASLIDGAKLSGARLVRYPHNNLDVLSSRLTALASEGVADRRLLVATDGVFSMDGDLAPLPDIAGLCAQHDALLMVDDAHGVGVLGQHGRGCLEHFSLSSKQVPVYIGTLGKAFGTAGAFVAGSEALIETLIQFSRSYIYTTAMPPAIAAASLKSLAIIQSEPWRRDHLAGLISRFRSEMAALGFHLLPSHTPIQPILVGEASDALAMSETLRRNGLLVTAIRPPTVAKGSARLRVTFSAAHTAAHLDRLLEVFSSLRPRGVA